MYKVSRGKKKGKKEREREGERRRRKARSSTDAQLRGASGQEEISGRNGGGADQARGPLRESEGPRYPRITENSRDRAARSDFAVRNLRFAKPRGGPRTQHFRVICAVEARCSVENCANEIPGQISARGGRRGGLRIRDSNRTCGRREDRCVSP